MALYLDRHDFTGVTAADAALAHTQDVEVQDKHGVRYVSYWFDYQRQHGFCLVEAPNPEAAEAVHRESHGMVAHNIIEMDPGAVTSFLGPAPVAPVGEAYEASAFRTIMFTDIVGSTALTQQLGDDGAMALVRRHDTTVRAALDAHAGREVKHTGDGIMASFSSASRAVECAITIQRELARLRDEDHGRQLHVRIGLAAGEPVTENDDLFGTSVQLAARLCGEADPGGILVSVAVRELCAGKQLAFPQRRELGLRGFAEPVVAFTVDEARA
jgi:class 3 adenylate cyclase